MHVGKRLAVILASGLAFAAAGGTLAATAGVAGARTRTTTSQKVVAGPDHVSSGCANGVYSGYCGTQKNVSDGFVFAIPGTTVTDWFTFAFQGGSNKIFEWAPNGVASNRCITVTASNQLVLHRCTGSTLQQFVAAPSGTGFTWQNVATGLFVQDNGFGKPLTTVAANGMTNQEWNFTTT